MIIKAVHKINGVALKIWVKKVVKSKVATAIISIIIAAISWPPPLIFTQAFKVTPFFTALLFLCGSHSFCALLAGLKFVFTHISSFLYRHDDDY